MVVASAAALLATFIAAAFVYAASAGELDRSFGHHGRVVPWGVRANVTSTDIGRKGRIVVAGTHRKDFMVARLRRDGKLDRSFSKDGVASIPTDYVKAGTTAVAIAPGGAALVAGKACNHRGDICHVTVFRLRPDGELNRRFGDRGRVRIDFGRQGQTEPSVALARHGRILVKTTDCAAGGSGDCRVGVARLRADGSFDNTFGEHGKTVTPIFYRARGRCAARFRAPGDSTSTMALDSRGRIVVLLSCAKTANPALARFKPNGDLDRSFGNGGTVFKEAHMGAVTALATDARDRIDVAGSKPNGFAVVRFQPNGKRDHSFGKDGMATAGFARDPTSEPVPFSIALDSRGRIAAGGWISFGPDHTNAGAFARFKPNGHVNRRFGRRGTKIVDRGLNFVDSISIDSRDRIVGAGDAVVRLLG